MDVETLIRALTGEERDELLAALTGAGKPSEQSTDDAEGGHGCCGGRRSVQRRREMMAEMRQTCCGAS